MDGLNPIAELSGLITGGDTRPLRSLDHCVSFEGARDVSVDLPLGFLKIHRDFGTNRITVTRNGPATELVRDGAICSWEIDATTGIVMVEKAISPNGKVFAITRDRTGKIVNDTRSPLERIKALFHHRM